MCVCVCVCVGPKDWATPAHFISSPRPTPRRKKCPRMNKEGPSCQEGESGMPLKTASPGVPSKND